MHRVNRLAAQLLAEPTASTVVGEPVVIDDPPENWPAWLPFPVHTVVPRFALGDREANEYLEREGCTFSRPSRRPSRQPAGHRRPSRQPAGNRLLPLRFDVYRRGLQGRAILRGG